MQLQWKYQVIHSLNRDPNYMTKLYWQHCQEQLTHTVTPCPVYDHNPHFQTLTSLNLLYYTYILHQIRSAYVTILYVTYRMRFLGNLKNFTCCSLYVDVHPRAEHFARYGIALQGTQYDTTLTSENNK